MRHLYSAFIFLYGTALKLASRFNPKARLWVDGRKGWYEILEKALREDNGAANPRVWFHASSLGEFEQGRPVIEAYREANPGHRIVLTFFSPSGFEVRKGYEGADWVLYLPLDTRLNARRWLDLVKPQRAVFIKYDYWYNFLSELRMHSIPVFFVSALFRPGQHFFRWYGGWFRAQLANVTWFFVQNETSEVLLKSIGLNNTTRTGDTRFDRVHAIALKKQSFLLIEKFMGKERIFICGSTWKEDENLLLPMISGGKTGLKFIVAPHDTGADRIAAISSRLDQPFLRYSQLTNENAGEVNILLIDSVGILAQLYQYATLAYVGGGFGSGLHNIQEPVTFGVPVFFGPGYHKFREAVDLVAAGGVFSVESEPELTAKIRELLNNKELYQRTSAICKAYVDANRGATAKIMQFLNRQPHPK